MRDNLWQKYKSFRLAVQLMSKNVFRIFFKTTLSGSELKNIPVIINNRNRLTFLKQLIEWFEKAGMKNIYILDNDSSYPLLLDYYKTITHKIIYLKKNIGYTALWDSPQFHELKKSYYIYTDPDVFPVENCPIDFVNHLYDILKKHPEVEKVGLGLIIDDLPDHYSSKKQVLELEGKYWRKKITEDLYDADVDTTLALYRPFAEGNAETCKAYRTTGKYMLRHLPWYVNSGDLSEEEIFYRNNVSKTSAYWSNLDKK